MQNKYADDTVLWCDKPLLKNTFFVWDLENIGFRYFESIQSLVKFTPEKLYAISKRRLHDETVAALKEKGFRLFEDYPHSADKKIIDLIKVHQGYTHLILVSSDSDFVKVVRSYLEHHHVQWIINDAIKKRICMSIDLTHPRLTLSTFVPEHNTNFPQKESIKCSQKRSKHYQSPFYFSHKNEKEWMNFFKRYGDT